MGYTIYWTFKKVKGVKAKDIEVKYQKAIIECQRIALKYNLECRDSNNIEARLSGYTAHCKLGQYGGIKLNGKGELSHEDFVLREHFNQNENDFCKTAYKPYDIVVKACLSVMKYRLRDSIEISSDGNAWEWIEGVKLASHILKRKIKNPIR